MSQVTEEKESLARSHLPFRAEYCKTSRAKCKKCSENMESGSLKLAVLTKSRFHDGYDASFYHVNCFFRIKRPQSVAEIAHFETLKFEDQKTLETAIETKGQSLLGVQVEPEANKKGSKKKSDASKRGPSASEQLCTYEDFLAGYAKSNRSKCKICDQKIDKDTVRLGKMDYDAETPHGGPVPRWYHIDCFVKNQEDLEFFGSVEKIAGFEELEKDDKRALKKKVKPIAPKVSRDPKKKLKTEENEQEAEEEKLLKEQSDRLFKLREFVNSMQRKDIEYMLEYMGQKSSYKSPSLLIDMATDVLLFGPIQKCPECKQKGHIQLRGGSYICTYGWDSNPCNYGTREPKRKEPNVPEDLIEKYEYFQTRYKFNGGKRLFSSKLLKAFEVKEAENNKIALDGAPLQGLNIGVISWNGLKNDKTKIQNKVVVSGGKLMTSLDSSLFIILASKSDLNKDSPKVEVAKALNIPFVSDEFLFKIKTEDDVITQFEKHLVIPWQGDLAERLANMKVENK